MTVTQTGPSWIQIATVIALTVDCGGPSAWLNEGSLVGRTTHPSDECP